MKKNLYICLITIVMIAMSINTFSQQFFYNAVTNDILAGSSDDVENTGNDVRLFFK